MDITREQLTEAMKKHLGAGDGPGLEHLVSAMWRELGQGAVDRMLAQARQAVVDGNSQAAADLYEKLDTMLGQGYPLPPAWGTPLASGNGLDSEAHQDLLAQAMGAARTPAQQGMAALAYLARMDSGPRDEAIVALRPEDRERLAHALKVADPEAPPFLLDGSFARPATEGEH